MKKAEIIILKNATTILINCSRYLKNSVGNIRAYKIKIKNVRKPCTEVSYMCLKTSAVNIETDKKHKSSQSGQPFPGYFQPDF